MSFTLRLIGLIGIAGAVGLWIGGCRGDNSAIAGDVIADGGTCVDMGCWSPEAPKCEGEGIEVFMPEGVCDNGTCRYASSLKMCVKGTCEGGVCSDNACQWTVCDTPERPHCSDDGGHLVRYDPLGACVEGECVYTEIVEPCDVGVTCEDGVCGAHPCHNVFCYKPPAQYCLNDDTLTVFDHRGVCAVNDDGTPRCNYSARETHCEKGCRAGRCVGDPCAGVDCSVPDSRYCDGDDLVVPGAIGRCDEGVCYADPRRIPCEGGCRNGACTDDPCLGITCNVRPASYCIDENQLRVYGADGVCEAGECRFAHEDMTCPDGCRDGRCIDHACEGVFCDRAVTNRCIGDDLLAWDGKKGACRDGSCVYDTLPIACEQGCVKGACTGDPCAGVTCAPPPADHCDMSRTIFYTYHPLEGHSEGACCDYLAVPQTCEHGCTTAGCAASENTDTDSASIPETDTADTESETDTKGGADTETAGDAGTPPDTDTGGDTDTETFGDTEDSRGTDPVDDCTGRADFTPCIPTDNGVSRAYAICIDQACLSPGCGDARCNIPVPYFPLPDTHQRDCYDNDATMSCPASAGTDFFGQDAQYGWDTTHSASSRFNRTTDLDDTPVVTDSVTGLMWQGCAAGLEGAGCTAGDPSRYNWEQALSYCDNLEWGSYTDWRLPDIYAADALLSASGEIPTIDQNAFLGKPTNDRTASSLKFWISATYAGADTDPNGRAWAVDFVDASIDFEADTKEQEYYVRCVRHPSDAPLRVSTVRFETTFGDEPTVTDNITALTWQGCANTRKGERCDVTVDSENAGGRTWKEALSYCDSLSWDGYTDWRLPNKTELQSLVDPRRSGPCIDDIAFPATPTNAFWSATTAPGKTEAAMRVSFNRGYVHRENKDQTHDVRCVRGGAK